VSGVERHVHDGSVVHNYVEVIGLEILQGALDDDVAVVLGEYVSLDDGSFRAKSCDLRSDRLGSCGVPY